MENHSSDRSTAPDAAAPAVDAFSIPAPGASSDGASLAAADQQETAEEPTRHRRTREARTDWRLGGRSVRGWREPILAVALIALALGLGVAMLVDALWTSPLASAVATGIVWVSLAVGVVFAFGRSRPIGLFRFRAVDLLYGVVLGVLLRTVQGWAEAAENGAAVFPSIALIDGQASTSWWGVEVIGALAVAPVLEELFFRGVILVGIYTLLRRPFGRVVAAASAVLTSSALFVLVHALAQGADLSATLSLFLLGVACAALVVLTGRIWGAVLVHLLFNATFLALAAVGTAFG